MLRRTLGWASPRRWSILVEAVLAALLALTAWPVIASNDQSDEVKLVTAYLEALREGDVGEAKSYIGPGQYPEADESLLTGEALSSDWQIESVRQRSADDTYVHAVISSSGQTAESVFSLEETEEDEFRILNPYAYVTVSPGLFQTLELNGLWHLPEALSENTTEQVALFPGSYRLFEDVPGFSSENAVSFLAMPQTQPAPLARLAGEAAADNDELEEQFNEDMAAWIDACVQSTEAAPEGCPFSAKPSYGDGVDNGFREFEEVEDLVWAVDVYPHVRIDSSLALETVVPGWVTLSGSGVAVWGEGGTERFQGRCGISLGSLDVTLLEEGRFEFTSTEDMITTCHR